MENGTNDGTLADSQNVTDDFGPVRCGLCSHISNLETISARSRSVFSRMYTETEFRIQCVFPELYTPFALIQMISVT